MIQCNNGGRILESPSELPPLPEVIQTLVCDFETGSGSPTLTSLNPFHHCAPCGIAVAWDDNPIAYYIPVNGGNWSHWQAHWPSVGIGHAYAWLRDAMRRSKRWANHHVKYDAHVYCRHIGQQTDIPEMVCTIVASKLIDSDRGYGRGTYALDSLSRDWLGHEIEQYEMALAPYKHNNKDYSQIPPDVIGPYGCQDVLTERDLYHFVCANMPTESMRVWNTEIKLTSVLLDMENIGVRVIPDDLSFHEQDTFADLLLLEAELHQITGIAFRPHVSDDCYDVLCGKYGLPVMGYTKDKHGEYTTNPSFDKDAMKLYAAHPNAPKPVISRIMKYRNLATLRNFFILPYQELHVDGILHSEFNQCVRTGRMSCKSPNAMQLSKRAKELIRPRDGYSFLSNDAMSVEFRLIGHYIEDPAVMAAFAANPDADFHQLIADMLGIKRAPAKTLNFAVGFGAGKKKVVKMLSLNEDIVGNIEKIVDEKISTGELEPSRRKQIMELMCKERGEAFYRQYHTTLPGIKLKSRKAQNIALRLGYIKNVAGRRRKLTERFSHCAFNSLNQSSAADVVKERMVALHEAYRGTPLRLLLQIHDELVTEGPTEVIEDPRVQRDVLGILEENTFNLRIPIRWSAGASAKHWREASDEKACPDGVRHVDRTLPRLDFSYLK